MTTTNTLITKPPAADLPKPAPATVTAINQVKAGFVAGKKPVKSARQPKNLDEAENDYLKFCIYGGSGTGKTITIAPLLEEGLTVLVLSTDIGGSGLSTVSLALKKKGKAELRRNCKEFEIQSYDELDDFISNPAGFWPDFFNTDIDVLFLDGFSAFQNCHLSEKVLGFDAGKNATDAREAGLFMGQQDWGATLRGTTRTLDKFLRMRNEVTGKSYSKIITCLESDKAKDQYGETKTGPMIQGAASKHMEAAFDIIFRARKKKKDNAMTYFYGMDGSSDRIITKSRGFEFNIIEPGDFGAIWKSACLQKGIPSGKKVAA